MTSTPPASNLDPVRIDARLFRQMIDHLLRSRPNEGCGLIAFDGSRPIKLFAGTNVHPQPESHYRMDDNEVLAAVNEMDRQGWWLGAIFHSHPNSIPTPSPTDVKEANWPDALMIIVSLRGSSPQVRAYRLIDGEPREVQLEVLPERVSWIHSLRERVNESLMPAGIDTGSHVSPSSIAPLAASGSQQSTLETRPSPSAHLPRRAMIGILGGMGPLATADLYTKIIEATPADKDQQHIPVIIYADPRVPDRTEALVGRGEDPTPWLVHGAGQLQRSGADFIVIPCNTAHAFLPSVQPELSIPILSMIDAAAAAIAEGFPGARVVGLLATNGTINSEMYQRALRARGIDTIVPDTEQQRNFVMAAIAEVKAGRVSQQATDLLVQAGQSLVERGADVLLAACTEIPVVLQQRHINAPLVDATDTLARIAVSTALHLEEADRSGAPQWETSTIGWDPE